MAAQPLLAVTFEQAEQKYSLTSQGRLFVAYTSTAPSMEGEECWREVSLGGLALRVLYTELSRFIEPREEEAP